MQDIQMLEMLKPCTDDGFVIQDREVSFPLPPFQLSYSVSLDRFELHWQPWYDHGSRP